MSFQENLKKFRIRAGYTQAKDFAKVLGISYPTYMGYENRGREPKFELLTKIASVLHVSIDDLLDNVPPKKHTEEKLIEQLSAMDGLMKDNYKIMGKLLSILNKEYDNG